MLKEQRKQVLHIIWRTEFSAFFHVVATKAEDTRSNVGAVCRAGELSETLGKSQQLRMLCPRSLVPRCSHSANLEGNDHSATERPSHYGQRQNDERPRKLGVIFRLYNYGEHGSQSNHDGSGRLDASLDGGARGFRPLLFERGKWHSVHIISFVVALTDCPRSLTKWNPFLRLPRYGNFNGPLAAEMPAASSVGRCDRGQIGEVICSLLDFILLRNFVAKPVLGTPNHHVLHEQSKK